MNDPIAKVGQAVLVECVQLSNSKSVRTIYHITAEVVKVEWICGRYHYTVTPIAGSGEFRISAERIEQVINLC